jgi:hypothetical protein
VFVCVTARLVRNATDAASSSWPRTSLGDARLGISATASAGHVGRHTRSGTTRRTSGGTSIVRRHGAGSLPSSGRATSSPTSSTIRALTAAKQILWSSSSTTSRTRRSTSAPRCLGEAGPASSTKSPSARLCAQTATVGVRLGAGARCAPS